MKKLLLAAFVAATFIIYSLHQRRDSAVAVLPVRSGSAPSVSPSASSSAPHVSYKDGRYVGDAADAYYGYIQVAATIQNGRISDVEFLQSPSDRSTSIQINADAMPTLKQEAIQAQSAKVDIVSGATDSSHAFIQSLTTALTKAQS